MKRFVFTLFIIPLFFACENAIKNEYAEVIVEEGTEVEVDTTLNAAVQSLKDENPGIPNAMESIESDNPLIGFWVGYFRKDDEKMGDSYDKNIYAGDVFYWERENKINISIESIEGEKVIGRSIVAGNDRPFEGTVVEVEKGIFDFKVAEPGDDYYDGEFEFTIATLNGSLRGTWEAYKDIDIKYRKYELEKKHYKYNPDQDLEYAKTYVDWSNTIESTETFEYEEGEFEEWITTEYATSTHLIYEVNGSARLLEKSEVENMKKGDLTIIRNAIYARHGYSFKNRFLRVFFDAQDWYIPVYTDIRNDFTDIELKNIVLLLKYEKNAAEYYDSFGRG
ncbi:MAG: YARHG domain-containing protein [Crocinitomicaceae bacterium]|nr:YARHG domain-containing protein [Crocinitomicaceae bacterium]